MPLAVVSLMALLSLYNCHRNAYDGPAASMSCSRGVLELLFDRVCVARGLKPLSISKDFAPPPQKWLICFLFCFVFEFFAIRDPFLRSFLADFTIFCNFAIVKWDHLLRIFWAKWDPCLKIFGEKVTHLGGTSLYALRCEYPPPPGSCWQIDHPAALLKAADRSELNSTGNSNQLRINPVGCNYKTASCGYSVARQSSKLVWKRHYKWYGLTFTTSYLQLTQHNVPWKSNYIKNIGQKKKPAWTE